MRRFLRRSSRSGPAPRLARVALGAALAVAAGAAAFHLRGMTRETGPETPTASGVVVRSSRPLMGTVFRLSAWAAAGREPAARAAALDAIEALEREISSWDPASDTSAVNRAAGRAVRVGAHLRELVGVSLHWAERTHGAFDPTAGRLFELWGAARQADRLPTAETVAAALAGVGYARVVVDRDTVRLPDAVTRLGFGAIGKGFAADQAGRMLDSRGLDAYVIDAGGDLIVSGSRGGAPWRVGVRHPRRAGLMAVLRSTDCAVATSGDYQQFVSIDGARYSHIIDPRTGWPAGALTSVTIVAARATDADALATAVSVLGADAGLDLVRSIDGVEAVVVREGGAVSLSDGVSLEGDELVLARDGRGG